MTNNLPNIKDGTYITILDEYKSIGMYVNCSNVIFFDSSGVEHNPKDIKKIHREQKYHNKYL